MQKSHITFLLVSTLLVCVFVSAFAQTETPAIKESRDNKPNKEIEDLKKEIDVLKKERDENRKEIEYQKNTNNNENQKKYLSAELRVLKEELSKDIKVDFWDLLIKWGTIIIALATIGGYLKLKDVVADKVTAKIAEKENDILKFRGMAIDSLIESMRQAEKYKNDAIVASEKCVLECKKASEAASEMDVELRKNINDKTRLNSWYIVGEVYRLANKYENAKFAYSKLLEENANDAQAQLGIAETLRAQSKVSSPDISDSLLRIALLKCDAVIENNPNFAEAYMTRAGIKFACGTATNLVEEDITMAINKDKTLLKYIFERDEFALMQDKAWLQNLIGKLSEV